MLEKCPLHLSAMVIIQSRTFWEKTAENFRKAFNKNTFKHDFIDKIDLTEYEEPGSQGKLKANIAELATFCHTEVVNAAAQFTSELNRVYYVTPAVYVEFFSLFNTTLAKRKGEMNQKKEQIKKLKTWKRK